MSNRGFFCSQIVVLRQIDPRDHFRLVFNTFTPPVLELSN